MKSLQATSMAGGRNPDRVKTKAGSDSTPQFCEKPKVSQPQ